MKKKIFLAFFTLLIVTSAVIYSVNVFASGNSAWGKCYPDSQQCQPACRACGQKYQPKSGPKLGRGVLTTTCICCGADSNEGEDDPTIDTEEFSAF